MKLNLNNKKGMEMVQVGILIAIAIGIGLIFKSQITDFINGTFSNLMNSGF
ncbi:Flp1 family type IVb pilin [Aminipila sp.]|uniref:Flp1 family type IVb pilin n=1 Tax=Aminipila sp. TaxID=2060095 RepID=UPI00289860FF|nr:Flp1 family type IVb pilin [Aminipila sp.]